jgi:hypothetical protein
VREEKKEDEDSWEQLLMQFRKFDHVDDEAEKFVEALEAELEAREQAATAARDQAIIAGVVPQNAAPPGGWRGLAAAMSENAAVLPAVMTAATTPAQRQVVSRSGRVIKRKNDAAYEFQGDNDDDV